MVRSAPVRKSAKVAFSRMKASRLAENALDKKLSKMKRVSVPNRRVTCKPTNVFKVSRNFQRQVRNVELSGSPKSRYYTCVAKRHLFKRYGKCSNLHCRNERRLGVGVAAHVGFRTEPNEPLKLGLTLVCQACNMGPREMVLDTNAKIIQLSRVETSKVSKLTDADDKVVEKDIYV